MAADNGTHQVVSGLLEQVEALAAELGTAGVRVERLNTSHAFHSVLMEPVLEGLEELLDGISVKPPEVALVSNLTGRAMESGDVMDGTYWRRHAREPVAFAEGVRTLVGLGVEVVVEIGPGPVLGPLVASVWPADGEERLPPAVIGSQATRRERRDGLRGSSGAGVRGRHADSLRGAARGASGGGGSRCRRIRFQRQSYWVEERKRRSEAGGASASGGASRLGRRGDDV